MGVMDTAKQIFVGVGDLMMGVEPTPATPSTPIDHLADLAVRAEALARDTMADLQCAARESHPGDDGYAAAVLVLARARAAGHPIDGDLASDMCACWGGEHRIDDALASAMIATAMESADHVARREAWAAIQERFDREHMTPIERVRLEERAAHSEAHNREVLQGMRDRSTDESGSFRLRGEYRLGSDMSHLRQSSGAEASRLGAVQGTGGRDVPDPRAAALARVRAAQAQAAAERAATKG